jgi:hypothetical protein
MNKSLARFMYILLTSLDDHFNTPLESNILGSEGNKDLPSVSGLML